MTDLLVSYPWGRFGAARREARRVLRQVGDDQAQIERTAVDGIAVVHTCLDNRTVIRQCRERFRREGGFDFAVKWAPVDWWCDTDLDAMRRAIEEHVVGRIARHETWGMKVAKRRWQRYHTREIVDYLAPSIDRKVDLDHPAKLLRIDVVGRRTAISLLAPREIFSAAESVDSGD